LEVFGDIYYDATILGLAIIANGNKVCFFIILIIYMVNCFSVTKIKTFTETAKGKCTKLTYHEKN
ncbi:MAG: hypothetical protein J5663_02240, partial [Bacteroidaceae bacterium]|nr:hypothetical protein [Bacteroidaceae bacterium]